MKKTKQNTLKKLFFSTLYLSTFTFGGGYVIITLLKEKFVDQYHWIEEDEMLDLIAIAQSSPGAVAVNGAIVVGYRLAGIPGVLVSVLGAVIPPMTIISLISVFYDLFRDNRYIDALLGGMTAGVGAVITSVVFDMVLGIVRAKDLIHILLLIVSFLASYVFHVNTALIILLTALFGLIRTLITERRKTAQ
ncbi:MAG: chromate transporter [Eubacteriales bacterium]|nr:chromate transporter [Eubacteriales bacterium]